MRTSLISAGTIVSTALLLTGCSSGGFSSVELKGDPKDGEVPKVDFKAPVEVGEEQTKTLREGDGSDIDPGDDLLVQVVVYRGSDGDELGNTYSQGGGQVLTMNDDLKERLPELYDALDEEKGGSIIAYSSPETAGASGEQDDSSTSVEVYQVMAEAPKKIEGSMSSTSKKLPKVTQDGDDAPKVTKRKDDQKAPDKLVSDYLIEGDGPEITEKQTVVADYIGVRWADGETFDSSWKNGAPQALNMESMIPGIKEGLKGKKVGSRVILSIPAEKAYGTEKELGEDSQYPTGDLLFVMDLLTAVDTPEPEPLPEPTSEVVTEGDGEAIADGDAVLLSQSPVTDGQAEPGQPQVLSVDEKLKKQDKFLYNLLTGSTLGTEVDVVRSTRDQSGRIEKQTTRFSLEKVIPQEISGSMKQPKGMPAVKEKDGTPVISEPKGKEPTKLSSKYLIEGDGEKIAADQAAVVDYVGVRWADGKVFDSSYDNGTPVVLPLDQVIDGWKEGLKGKKVGSRVEIVIPAEKAYGTEKQLEEAGDTSSPAGALVFVVDILGSAQAPAQG